MSDTTAGGSGTLSPGLIANELTFSSWAFCTAWAAATAAYGAL